ncbi:low molecular weight phosphotyrosine protein phosphatase [Microbacterium sp. LRZ72]|uniref:low molecular weight protein-tyrosine-phosphatase n=1 Tax=Microbacterium sp. LRZ72 TaxID=2942481 RepID=UPI0029BBB5B3|nr:low molecular weight protein-tyrosine-phosphatase [Microbacterium sp. LRZ72]MDX2376150.1 low molecular weight phosphotyrosine protein phosphatase [Microbacterium sp. LRZ72]
MHTAEHPPVRVVFVCTGNICRSPMAEVVLRRLADDAGYGQRLVVTSAGTGDWHVGGGADPRTIDALARRGYDGAAHRAQQVADDIFDRNDLVVALDAGHARMLRALTRSEAEARKITSLMAYAENASTTDVPDPYQAGPEAFDDVLAMIEDATRALFLRLEPDLAGGPPSATVPPGASS